MAQIPQHYTINRLTGETTLTVEVYLSRQFRLRVWLGKHLIRLAALVMGCAIEITDV